MTTPQTHDRETASPPARASGPLLLGLFIGLIFGVVAGYPLGGLLPGARATLQCADATKRHLDVLAQELEAGRTDAVLAELRDLRDRDFTFQDSGIFADALERSMDRLLEDD